MALPGYELNELYEIRKIEIMTGECEAARFENVTASG
jgi:hypothetical protein